jgi:hypothetical protein
VKENGALEKVLKTLFANKIKSAKTKEQLGESKVNAKIAGTALEIADASKVDTKTVHKNVDASKVDTKTVHKNVEVKLVDTQIDPDQGTEQPAMIESWPDQYPLKGAGHETRQTEDKAAKDIRLVAEAKNVDHVRKGNNKADKAPGGMNTPGKQVLDDVNKSEIAQTAVDQRTTRRESTSPTATRTPPTCWTPVPSWPRATSAAPTP